MSTSISAMTVAAALAAAVILWPYPVRVVDGDTVDRWPFRYRLEGFDAPEIGHRKCEAELAAGRAAKQRLQDLVDGAQRVRLIIVSAKLDRWRRFIARMEVDGRDVRQIALSEGWGQAWTGRGPKPDWCHDAR